MGGLCRRHVRGLSGGPRRDSWEARGLGRNSAVEDMRQQRLSMRALVAETAVRNEKPCAIMSFVPGPNRLTRRPA
jgi:hypothetical protein